ncbi:Predicted flavoprotein involved in K+ transport [Streptomyces clavuligerus]|uniref:Predicted flavoprotein involved in K+ transport n=2 Tax=Streptomyces clavuligerus TaxID=1901 RepID=E2Q092_STRCL|nr:Predicted flavoprotein involved in K+ transport [Streptomyces clavuligerus]
MSNRKTGTEGHRMSERAETAPVSAPGRHVSVVIVGAGFAGIGTAVRLLREGHWDLLILERADEVGGAWRDNTYPGCACDVPSRLYSFSFAPNPEWSRRYAPQREIARYLRHCAESYALEPHLRLGCELRHAAWNADRQRWELRTGQGPLSADHLVMAQGPLSEPAVPALPGLDGFTGDVFHSARWRHDLDLSDRRVAVIGTGASAVQFVPHLQRAARRVTVFQRTPPWIMPRHDRPVPAWLRGLYRRAPWTQRLARLREYTLREAGLPALLGDRALAALGRGQALAHLHRQVDDPVLRGKLTPDYALGCKRVLMSDDYYPALGAPNVDVVTEPVVRVTEDAVLTAPADSTAPTGGSAAPAAADGSVHPVDVLVLGTGFRVTDAAYARLVTGTGGRTLHDVWQGSPQAYLGTTVAGFPNLWLMAGPNTGVGHTSLIYMIESQIDYLLGCLRFMDEHRVGAVDVRAGVQLAYNTAVQRRMTRTVWAAGGCAGWYRDRQGRITTIWPEPTWRFRRRTRGFDPDRYTLTARPGGSSGPAPHRPTTSAAD